MAQTESWQAQAGGTFDADQVALGAVIGAMLGVTALAKRLLLDGSESKPRGGVGMVVFKCWAVSALVGPALMCLQPVTRAWSGSSVAATIYAALGIALPFVGMAIWRAAQAARDSNGSGLDISGVERDSCESALEIARRRAARKQQSKVPLWAPLVVVCLCFVLGCQDGSVLGAHPAYVYKQVAPDGVVSIRSPP